MSTKTLTRPRSFWITEDGRGKYHAAEVVTSTAVCGAPVILDTRNQALSITVAAGEQFPHPIVCRRCLAAVAKEQAP